MKDDCKPFVEKLCDSLGEDVDSPLCLELKEHLANCPDCSLQVNTIKRTVEIYRSLPARLIPGEVRQRLWLRLNLTPSAQKTQDRR